MMVCLRYSDDECTGPGEQMFWIIPALFGFVFSQCQGDDCVVDSCNQGISILQYDTTLPLGPNRNQYSYLPNAANGTILNSGIFCTSSSVCFIQSNNEYGVPGCGKTIQLS